MHGSSNLQYRKLIPQLQDDNGEDDPESAPCPPGRTPPPLPRVCSARSIADTWDRGSTGPGKTGLHLDLESPADPVALAPALAQEDRGSGAAVGYGFDIHGNDHNGIYMGTKSTNFSDFFYLNQFFTIIYAPMPQTRRDFGLALRWRKRLEGVWPATASRLAPAAGDW